MGGVGLYDHPRLDQACWIGTLGVELPYPHRSAVHSLAARKQRRERRGSCSCERTRQLGQTLMPILGEVGIHPGEPGATSGRRDAHSFRSATTRQECLPVEQLRERRGAPSARVRQGRPLRSSWTTERCRRGHYAITPASRGVSERVASLRWYGWRSSLALVREAGAQTPAQQGKHKSGGGPCAWAQATITGIRPSRPRQRASGAPVSSLRTGTASTVQEAGTSS